MIKIFNCEECGAETSSASPLARYCSKRCKCRVKDRRRTPERNPQYWQRRKQRQKERYQENYERLRPYYQKWRREHRVPKNCRTCGIALPFGQRKYCSQACQSTIKKQNKIRSCKSCGMQVLSKRQYCESCRIERERYWAIRWRLDPDYRAAQLQLRRQRRAKIQAAKVFLRELQLIDPPPQSRPDPNSRTNRHLVAAVNRRALKRECMIEAERLWNWWHELLKQSDAAHPFLEHRKNHKRGPLPMVRSLYSYISELLALRGMYVKPRRIMLWRSKNWRLPKMRNPCTKIKRRYDPTARRAEYHRELERHGREKIRTRKREQAAMNLAILRTLETTLKPETTQ